MKYIQRLIQEDINRRDVGYKESHPAGYWHPSSLGRCYRLQYYQMIGANQNDNGNDNRLVPLIGTLNHKYVQSLLPDNYCEIGGFDEENKIHWSCDYFNKETNTVYDFKFTTSYAFRYVKKVGYDFATQKICNILQLTCYAMELKIPNCCLLFINRDDFSMVEFKFKAEQFHGEVKQELEILNRFKQHDVLPPAIPRAFNGKDCNYCSFSDWCHKEQIESVRRL